MKEKYPCFLDFLFHIFQNLVEIIQCFKSSNGLMDLWAEFKILDMGERLCRFISHYRDEFFTPDKRNGQIVFSYKLKPNAEDEIYKRIADILAI